MTDPCGQSIGILMTSPTFNNFNKKKERFLGIGGLETHARFDCSYQRRVLILY